MTIVICTDHLYNQLFSENVIVEGKKKSLKLFTELCLVAWNASCIFLYGGLPGRS